jgi:hypothetical protein
MEDNAEIPFFEGSFNNLFPSDSGLHDGYRVCTQQKKKGNEVLFAKNVTFPFMQGYVMRNITHKNNTRSLNLDPVNISFQSLHYEGKIVC